MLSARKASKKCAGCEEGEQSVDLKKAFALSVLGKTLGRRQYLALWQVPLLPNERRCEIALAEAEAVSRGCSQYNLVRYDESQGEVAFLHYPTLGVVPFPALSTSWRVHIKSGLVSFRSYSQSLNPPILHRTELFLEPDHPNRAFCAQLTKTAESIGLFELSSSIGYARQWADLISSRGYYLDGFELKPVGNATDASCDPPALDSGEILRHKTALSRSIISAPVQSVLRDGLLTIENSFFDYGCGKGDDLTALRLSGFSGRGWDPYFRPDDDRVHADVVNLGFVINVIEDKEERIFALESAFELAERVLVVSAMLGSNIHQLGTQRFRDGIVTSRRTFQKYYTQGELQAFIESVLNHDAYPAAPGIFYVFKDRCVEQAYLRAKSADRSRVARARLASVAVFRPRRERSTPTLTALLSAEQIEYLNALWAWCLELGRPPAAPEILNVDTAIRLFGSANRAVKACLESNDAEELKRASEGRKSEILVMLALQSFEGRQRFKQLDTRTQVDMRYFFGSHANAISQAQALLFSVQDTNEIFNACRQAADAGIGFLVSDEALQLHSSLVERLPAVLRVYIGCAAALAGAVTAFDLVKLHINSGKVTLLSFEKFDDSPVPTLRTRIKVRLRDQDLDIFEYSGDFKPTVLLGKSRFINEEYPRFAEQLDFDEKLASTKLFDFNDVGLKAEHFYQTLIENRFRIDGLQLNRSVALPLLDQRCGSNFTYRQLIECGTTWERYRVDNTPKQPETFNALFDLVKAVLDPVVEYFGGIKLTYGFASPALTRNIKRNVAPRIDQHVSCELNTKGSLYCERRGAAVDFLVEDENMVEVAEWISANCSFDRMYIYGQDRPIHVSVGPNESREIFLVSEKKGRRIPSRVASWRNLRFDQSDIN